MKKIDILGKRNQDKMKQMEDPNAIIERKAAIKGKNAAAASTLPDEYYTTDQSLALQVLKVPTQPAEPNHKVRVHLIREIDTKRKAYIYQDKNHEIYDPRFTITTDRIVELLVSSELLCYYCREICQVAYKEAMCRRQWTLDRIDNNYGHNDTNVVIACLDCNLKRGTMDSERFRQGKQFTFRKVE
jgi:hypothetical protein